MLLRFRHARGPLTPARLIVVTATIAVGIGILFAIGNN
jgi:hypothetical protein